MKCNFVLVQRVKHGDTMHIPDTVQKQYPDEFILIDEEAIAEAKEDILAERVEVVKELEAIKKTIKARKGK